MFHWITSFVLLLKLKVSESAIEKYGISDWHRKSFSICNKEKTLLKKEIKNLKNKIENEEKEKEKINKNINDYFNQDL